MHRACVVAIAFGLCGCWSYSFDVPSSSSYTADEPAGPSTWGPLPPDPTPPLRVWIGVPPAVVTRIPTSKWPEYEPLSLPWDKAIWVPEHWDWDWDGTAGWQWLRGRFIERPGPGYEWNPPSYVVDETGSYFVPGFFCAPPEPVECVACKSRPELHRSKVACSPGLSASRKHALARRAAQPDTILVSR
jgi:hypothetical protein